MYNRQLNRANSQKASGARRDKSKAIGAVVVVVIAFLVSSVVYVRVLSCCALVWVLFTRKMLIKVLLNQTEKNLYNRIRVPTEILRNATKSQSWKRNKKKKRNCVCCAGVLISAPSRSSVLSSLSLSRSLRKVDVEKPATITTIAVAAAAACVWNCTLSA